METATKIAKKKILYFIPEFPGLTETFIEREVSKLIEFGNLDVTVLSLRQGVGVTSKETLEKVYYRRLNFLSLVQGLFYIITNPLRVYSAFTLVSKDNSKSFLGILYLFIKSLGYAKIFSFYNPDHIHVHFLSESSTIALIVSIVLNVPFSISGHARDVFVEGTLIPEKVKHAEFVVICNGYSYRKCIELAGKDLSDKIHKIYHGVSPDLFKDAPKVDKPPVPLIFLGGTRLVEKKGLRYMIDASKILKKRGIAHKVVLVGPGNLYEELSEYIKKLDLEDTVIIIGEGRGTPFEIVKEYYKIADIFVLPSIETAAGDADGVPTVVIEAAIAKLPIITTNAGGISDLILDGETGIIIPQRDAQALAEKIDHLIIHPELRKSLGEKAYTRAIVLFDLDENVKKLEELLLI
jgi:colanic acid/amylovoran biosynthesis glycosyltransferase